MAKPGKFILNNFKGQSIEVFTSNENEYVHYSDTDLFSWTIIRGIVSAYDEDTGILTLKSLDKGLEFYLNEYNIHLFWKAGLDYRDMIRPTINGLKKDRDIM